MEMKIVQNGELRENCYVLEENNKYLVIDPGSEFDKIDSYIKNDGQVLAILVTHRHFDHIGALDDCVRKYRCPVYDKLSTLDETYNVGPFSFNVISCPGHTPDSISFYFYKEKKLFSGDFIFEGNIILMILLFILDMVSLQN